MKYLGMLWNDVDALFKYSQIIVTGPQRSGTTFTARALSETLVFDYIDEDEIKVRDADKLQALIDFRGSFVVQAPGCTHLLHRLSGADVAIVWVHRPLQEIIASQERVGWTGEAQELKEYRTIGVDAPSNLTRSAEVKEWHWSNWQQSACKLDTFEIEYHSPFLKNHPLRVPVNQRKSFKIRQWSR